MPDGFSAHGQELINLVRTPFQIGIRKIELVTRAVTQHDRETNVRLLELLIQIWVIRDRDEPPVSGAATYSEEELSAAVDVLGNLYRSIPLQVCKPMHGTRSPHDAAVALADELEKLRPHGFAVQMMWVFYIVVQDPCGHIPYAGSELPQIPSGDAERVLSTLSANPTVFALATRGGDAYWDDFTKLAGFINFIVRRINDENVREAAVVAAISKAAGLIFRACEQRALAILAKMSNNDDDDSGDQGDTDPKMAN